MKLKILLFLFFSQVLIFSQIDTTVYFPLEIGNRWDFKSGEWSPSGPPVSYDTLVYKITTDTLMPNGHKYFKISPGYVNFNDFIRADSIGIYFYDIRNNREWLFFKFNLELGIYSYPNSAHLSIAYDRDPTDSTWYIKIYKWADYNMYLFGDSTRVIRYFYDTGLDDSYFITISPKYGFIGIEADAWQATYYQSLLGCTISGITYGILTAISVEKQLPDKFQLFQNYPNPFNPETAINYQLSSRSFVTLKVFDVLGREVATLVNEEKPAGRYEVSFNANKLSSGIYFYTVTAGSFHKTKKMLLLK